MKRYQYRKFITTAITFMMIALFLNGCAGSGERMAENGTDNTDSITQGGAQSQEQSADGMAMGRYIEEVLDLSDMLDGYREQLFKLQSEKIVITRPMGNLQKSEDGGASWQAEEAEWLDDLFQEGKYIDYYAVGADGTIGIVYDDTRTAEDSGDTDSDTITNRQENNENMQETDVSAGDLSDQDRTDNDTAEDSGKTTIKKGTEEDFWGYHNTALIVKPDGTQIPVTLPGEDERPAHIWISDDGKVFVGTDGEKLYEIGEDGIGKIYLTLEAAPQLIQFQGNYMIVDGWDYDGLLIYDMEAEEYIEDRVLNDFVRDNYGDRSFNGGSWYDMYFFLGEENVLYLAGKCGVHRHVLGGSAMEQVIDANLTTFGNPSYRLLGMTAIGGNEFLALFTDARLVRYTYDSTVPTMPNERVKAYSLEENTMLRNAIALYQTDHPEVYVEYENGMEEGSAVTREDALKKLNTEIMAGEGPDLLILDDIPADSYMEKGLLKDLSSFVDGLNGDEKLFDNIVDAFRQDGKLYTIPCEVSFPMIMGKEKYVAKMTDLEGLADGIEALRKDNPGKDLLYLCSPKAILKNFVTASAPAWMTDDGELNRKAIEEFYIQMKRIYDAQMEGLPEEIIREYERRDEENIQYYDKKIEDQKYYMFDMDEFHYLIAQNRQLLAGIVGYAYAYAELTSVQRMDGFEDDVIVPMCGTSSHVFCVQTLAGINASSDNTAHAEGLLKQLLGAKKISSLGFPINQAAFEKELYPDDEVSPDESYSTLGYLLEDGQYFEWSIYWFDDVMADELRNRMKTADTPYVENTTLEDAVFRAGVQYMNGEVGLDEAVADVEKRMEIYLAE
ncbi:MAG: hypothetical protein NC416_17625 [Eubacterium sp.]|nr:hypothetical protein [Eubacterium sp.]